jgi:RNA recognition motif-containing protein
VKKDLYVGNLATEVTEEDLRTNFSKTGTVLSVRIIKDKYSGLSKGFGFVEMETAEEAQEVITKFNGGELCGQTIRVSEAKPKRDQGRPMGNRGPRHGGYGGGQGRGGGGHRY